MIHAITVANRSFYEPQIAQMHAQRKAFFVDQLGWKRCDVRDGGEYDDMDDERAVYLLSLNSEGGVQAGLRMRPADDRSIILDKFPRTIDPQYPGKSPLVWEGSRIYQIPTMRGATGIRVKGELRIAAIEFGMTRAFKGLLGMCDVKSYAALQNNGWRTKVLGPEAPYDEGMAFSFIAEISADAVIDVRNHYQIFDPVLLELPVFPDPETPHSIEARLCGTAEAVH